MGSNGLLCDDGHGASYQVRILGLDISRLSQSKQFVLVSAGVLCFFILYGYVLVSITKAYMVRILT